MRFSQKYFGVFILIAGILATGTFPGEANPLRPEFRRDRLKVDVKVSVRYDELSGFYHYYYTVTNLPESEQSISTFGLEGQNGFSNPKNPLGWFMSMRLNSSPFFWMTVALPGKVPLHMIRPGQTVRGFTFMSQGMPEQVKYYAQGYVQFPKGFSTSTMSVEERRALALPINSVTGYTTGPGTIDPRVLAKEEREKARRERQKEAWSHAEEHITRRPISDFTQLPPPVAKELTRRNCTIPQVGYGKHLDKNFSNIISGEFKKKGQTDWAALCSVDKKSVILVFWDGSAREVDQIGKPIKDTRWVQMGTSLNSSGEVEHSFLYVYKISTIRPDKIKEYFEYEGSKTLPSLTHQGIVESGDKGSQLHYWHEGQWMSFYDNWD